MDNSQLQLWMDKLAIQEVAVRYAAAPDQRRWEIWEEIFTDPIELLLSPKSGETRKIARAKWIEHEKSVVESYPAQQLALSNFLIEVEGDKAICQVYLQLRHFVKDTETDILFGYFTFHMIRSGSGWKINKYGITLTAMDQQQREKMRRFMKTLTPKLE
jgi:3-phenylpropionate/cinnamic acid dioxygenase small subunit